MTASMSFRDRIQAIVRWPVEYIADFQLAIESEKLKRLNVSQPIIVDDPELGEFRYDRLAKAFEQDREWGGEKVTVTLWCDDPALHSIVFSDARTFFARADQWRDSMREGALDHLLELAEQDGDGTGESVRQAINKTMKLWNILFDGDGRFTVMYHPDGIIAPYYVAVEGAVGSGVDRICI